MRKRIHPVRRRIRKLYELCIVAFFDKTCYFCKKPLIRYYHDLKDVSYKAWLGGFWKEDILLITNHHKDENREHNMRKNFKLCHQACHKSYHMKREHKRGTYKGG